MTRGIRTCTKCWQGMPLTQMCVSCQSFNTIKRRLYARKYYALHVETLRPYNVAAWKKWMAKHPEKKKEYNASQRLREKAKREAAKKAFVDGELLEKTT